MNLEQKYPNISNWMANGCIELGYCDDYTGSTARVTDGGGTIWETEEVYPTLDALLDAIEEGIAQWCAENGIELGE